MIQMNLSAKQTYIEREQVCSCHGDGWGSDALESEVSRGELLYKSEQTTGSYCVMQGTVFTVL